MGGASRAQESSPEGSQRRAESAAFRRPGNAARFPRRDYLKFSIDYPGIKFELESASPERSLPEVRRIIEALNAEQEASSGDAELYALKAHLSDEFFRHAALRSRVRSALVLGEDVRVLKSVIPIEQEYDLETGRQARQVSALGAKAAVSALFGQLDGTVRDCMVHIRGELSREQQRIVMDAIRQRLGVEVRPRFFSTRRNLEGKVLVEAVCFGERLGIESQ